MMKFSKKFVISLHRLLLLIAAGSASATLTGCGDLSSPAPAPSAAATKTSVVDKLQQLGRVRVERSTAAAEAGPPCIDSCKY